MNKKIIAIAIISMFILAGLSSVSAGTNRQVEQNIMKNDDSSDSTWEKDLAVVYLHSIENLEMTINGNSANLKGLKPDLEYENVTLTGYQKEVDYHLVSFAISFLGHFGFMIAMSLATLVSNLNEKAADLVFRFLLKSFPRLFALQTGYFEITIDKMQKAYYGEIQPDDHQLYFVGWDVAITQ